MDVRKIVGVTVFGMAVGTAGIIGACASGPDSGGGDDYTTRIDAADFVSDDGSVEGESTMIDDLEDGDESINQYLGRIGNWYSFNDGTAGATQTPAESGDFKPTAGGARGSAFAAATSGKGFKDWGAGIGLDLNSPPPAMVGGPEPKLKYDASQYTGIAFEAKGNVSIRVSVAEIATIPMADGGTCVPGTVDGMMCEDYHGKQITLTSGWKSVEIPFADLKQEGFGYVSAFDAATLTGLQFSVAPNVDFNFAVDNVRFY